MSSMYLDLLEKCHSHNLFECREKDAFGRSGIPLGFKLLGVLRMLGKGGTFDDVSASLLMSEDVARTSFATFVRNFVRCFYKQYVYFPSTEEELKL